MVTLFQPFKSDGDQNSATNGLECQDLSLTKQSFKDEADINVLVERFGITGQLPDKPLPEHFGDFSEAVDFQSAMLLVRRAGEDFLTIPAQVRERFDNDPQKLMAFLAKETNRQEAIDLGLIPPPPVESLAQPSPVKAVEPKPDNPVGSPADFSRKAQSTT